MRKPIFVSAQEAVGMIQDYSTLCTIGMTLVSASETVLKAIEQKFLDTGTPRGLTLFHTCGQSDRKDGIAHLAHEGLVTKVIGGHWGLCPPFMEMISENRLEAYNLPQGQMANMFHSMALREPGKLSKIGLGTFVDPRIEGGKMNSRTMDKEDICSTVRCPLTHWSYGGPTQMKQGISVRKKRQWFWRFFLLSWQPNGLEER